VSCYGLIVLGELCDNFAMRREVVKEDWVARVIVAMSNLKTNTNEIMIQVSERPSGLVLFQAQYSDSYA